MRFVYFGTSQFAADLLGRLCDMKIAPVLVVSTPDTRKGRGLALQPSPVTSFTQSTSLRCMCPEDLLAEESIQTIKDVEPDVFIVASYGKLIPKRVLSLANKFPLGVHPSLLPHLRGAAPVQWVLINGETTTGVTVFVMDEKIDNGPILVQEKLLIHKGDDYFSLSERLSRLSAQCIEGGIALLNCGNYELMKQEQKHATYARKLKKDDGKVNWGKNDVDIINLIRGTKEWPGAYTFYKGKQLKVIDAACASVDEQSGSPGTVLIKGKSLYVSCAHSYLEIRAVKPQGKKEMSAESFINGYRVKTGDIFD